jgi:hypothetical protein
VTNEGPAVPETTSDAETVTLEELHAWLNARPQTVRPPLLTSPADKRKHAKLRVRSVLAFTLVAFYVVLTLYICLSIINGWVEFDEIRDFVTMVYGGLIGLLGTAIALVGKKGSS